MANAFFPNPVFAWVFCLTLFGLTCLAAWIDTRKAKVPNQLTVLIFVLGLVANVVRSIWLAVEAKPLWVFDTGAWWLGLFDGLLFSLAGFVVVFAIMFGGWIFGLCGGGDVKLLAAVATWLGLPRFLFVWLASLLTLVAWTIGQLVFGGLTPRKMKKNLARMNNPNQNQTPGRPAANKRRGLRTTLSFPVAVATALVLMWLFRVELGLVKPKSDQHQGASAHARPAPTHA